MRKAHKRMGGTPKATKARVQPLQLDAEWQRWIAENLLLGADVNAVLAALTERGCPADMAEAEVSAAVASPYLRGAAILQSRLQKRDWLLESYGRLAAIDGALPPVASRRAIQADDFFRDFYAMHRPVLLHGMIDHWPAMKLWSVEHVETLLGNPLVQVQTRRDADPDYETRSDQHRELVRLKAFTERLRSPDATNDVYLTANNNDQNRAIFAPLWAEVGRIDGILREDANEGGFLWMGPKGTVTPFHHDLTNNLLIQVRGRKKVWLVPSWETPRMRNHKHCYSLHAGPAAIEALPPPQRPAMIECLIEPGDALFIPVGWWHHVEGLDATIGLSFTQFERDNDFYTRYSSYGAL